MWETYPSGDGVPQQPGVYAVFINGDLLYIGSSMNVRTRLSNHALKYARYSATVHTPWGDFKADEWVVKYRPSRRYGDWAMVELRLIRRLCPRFNIAGKGA